jgi:glycosyltransferase involved in cell wall biosynthesis
MSTDVAALPAALRGLRVALVHDWVNGYRGGEKVLQVFAEMFPGADLYTLFYVPGSSHPDIERRCVLPSWMNRLPGVQSRYRWLLPLFPGWADRLDLSDYDLVISSSHCVAKGARAPRNGVHVCYCHTPMRYVWDQYDDYFGHMHGPKEWAIRWQCGRLRGWDRRTAPRVDVYLANSGFVRDRIVRYYGTPPERVNVVHPPVDLEAFPSPAGALRQDRYLVVSALVPQKRVHEAVEACLTTGRALTVAGSGPERARLEAMVARAGAADRIGFLGFVPDEELPGLMASHRALLFPGVEDFGITPVEATAMGLPVVAYGRGGALETVLSGVNGHLYGEPGAAALARALHEFERLEVDWNAQTMREHAARFARPVFVRQVTGQLTAAVAAGSTR